MPTTTAATKSYRVRRSPIHGTGVFATAPIAKGTRLVEYVGERVSHAEADRRYEDKDANDNHTFLFTVDDRIVIDAGVGGNAARWINHSCDPNCETVIEDKRVYIEAARHIARGEELAYDYMISREPGDPPDIEQIFACRCGAGKCRGTMLLPPQKKKRKARRGGKAAGKRVRQSPARATRPAATRKGAAKKPAKKPPRKPTATGRSPATRARKR
jgi:hypothetical protein